MPVDMNSSDGLMHFFRSKAILDANFSENYELFQGMKLNRGSREAPGRPALRQKGSAPEQKQQADFGARIYIKVGEPQPSADGRGSTGGVPGQLAMMREGMTRTWRQA